MKKSFVCCLPWFSFLTTTNEAETCLKIEEKVCEDRISALPEDVLLQILLLLPTKDAVATTILSKRWRSIWKMLPKLVYKDTDNEGDTSVWWFLDKSLQLHKAPVLEHLEVELGSTCPVNVDVGKWVDNVVERCIQWLEFKLLWSAEPTSLSKRLYTCKTLKELTLSNKILVDVPSQASLPSLEDLRLFCVVYKDEDSLVRLLSSCPVLQNLFVDRKKNDNVTTFSVKVPSLWFLRYVNCNDVGEIGGSVVIDSPGLKIFNLYDTSEDAFLIENMPPCLDMAKVEIYSHPNDKFLRSLSSVMYLNLNWIDETDAICSAINFSRLIECKLTPFYSEYWVEPIMILLYNCPKLKVLMINSEYIDESVDLPLWSSAPGCLSSHLEIFEWEEYGGTIEEKKLLTYILANSKCLKTAGISPRSTYNDEEKKKMMEELESMFRVSTSCQLLFSAQFRWTLMKCPDLEAYI